VKKSTIEPGDKYIKVDATNIIWVVGKPLNVADPVPHARLVQEGMPNRKITLSISALQDTSIYKKIKAKTQAG
jgi:hypothetical protein